MLRGLFTGGLCGLVVGGASLGVASLATEQPAGNTPPAAPQVTAPESADPTTSQSPANVADMTDATPQDANAAPRVATPQIEVTQPMADTASADVPVAAIEVEDISEPMEALHPPEVIAANEEPVLPNPQSIAPQVPVNEDDLTISTAPAAVPTPVEIAVSDEEEAMPSTIDIAVPTPIVEEVVALPAPSIVTPEDTAPTAPQVITLPSADSAEPSMPTGVSGVKVNRIVTPEVVEETVPEAAEIPEDAPAIVRFASPFENPENKPLMSLVLLDDGSLNGAVNALKTLNFPVTVVLDPSRPDAAEMMAAYRGAGIEVGVQAALPAGAAPTDVEIAFEATFAALPDTVILFDAGEGGLQSDRAVIDQALLGLAESGRGLVSVSKGLNTAMREAEKLDVPAGVIFRDLDSEGQDARVIRRFLDQAAFRARQESGVILLARIRPDTISALQLWGTANRSGQVALAPVSAILQAE